MKVWRRRRKIYLYFHFQQQHWHRHSCWWIATHRHDSWESILNDPLVCSFLTQNCKITDRIQSSYISSKFWLQIRQLQILHPKNKAKQLFIIMNFKILWTVYIYDIQLVLSLEKLIINSSFALFLGCNIRSCLIWSQKYTKIIFYIAI